MRRWRHTVEQRNKITPEDKERIARLALLGLSPEQIARRLDVSISTARKYSKYPLL